MTFRDSLILEIVECRRYVADNRERRSDDIINSVVALCVAVACIALGAEQIALFALAFAGANVGFAIGWRKSVARWEHLERLNVKML